MMPYGYGYGLSVARPKALQPPSDSLYLRLFAHSDYFALSSGKITTWQGTGSSGLSAVQATGAYQPSPGSGINGKTTVVFAGSQYLVAPSVALGVFDIFIVIKMSVWPKTIIGQGTSVYSDSGISLFSGQSTSTAINRGSGTTTLSARQSYYPDWLPTDSVARMVRFGHDGTHAGHVLEKDGVGVQQTTTYSSNNPGLSVITKDLVIGGSGIFSSLITGEIGEILIYSAAPDSGRAAKVLAYSRKYWGTP